MAEQPKVVRASQAGVTPLRANQPDFRTQPPQVAATQAEQLKKPSKSEKVHEGRGVWKGICIGVVFGIMFGVYITLQATTALFRPTADVIAQGVAIGSAGRPAPATGK